MLSFIPRNQPMEAMAILVVDDNPIKVMFIEKCLRTSGFTQIYSAASGEEAIAFLEREPVDMVILDVMMPGINGFECCKQIRAMPQYKELPILIETACDEPERRVSAFDSGATDFITSPLLPEELRARVNLHLLNRKYIRDLRQYKERMTYELDAAYKLQVSILPQQAECAYAYNHRHLDIAFHFEPSSEIGGDFWGFKFLSEHQTAVWSVDFSGHGISAALNAFRLQAYLHENSAVANEPGEYMTLLNKKLLQLLPRGHFATMFYGVIDTANDTISYACACAPEPMVMRAGAVGVEHLNGEGNLLGVSEWRYDTRRVPFGAGDALVLYSDALIETANEQGEMIGEKTLSNLLAGEAGLPAPDIRDKILGCFREFTQGELSDDLTLCVCKRI